MSASVLVDTNVLIYALDEANPKKHEAAGAWRAELWKSHRGWISFQVLQQFYAMVTHKRPMRLPCRKPWFLDSSPFPSLPVT